LKRTLVISDIHGCLKTFKQLLTEIVQYTKEDTLYLLGDYIDRGPDSKGVIDYILYLKKEGYSIFTLRGNHEQLLLEAYGNFPLSDSTWRRNGGEDTLRSFNIRGPQKLTEEYISFFSSLGYYAELDHFILVHAGLNFEMKNPFEDLESMLWIRRYEVDPVKINNKIIVQGHTPTPLESIRTSILNADKTHRIFLDNGCVYGTEKEGFGNLCCLNLLNRELLYCPKID
jgi:serine/threonine protein phosphatase 1